MYEKFKNKLPQGWVECQLEDILSNEKYSIKRGPFGSSLKKAFFVPSGIRVFEQYNPINNDPYWSRYYITESKYKELESFTAKAGDFLVSCSGTLGKILQLPVDVEMGIINQALLKITVNNDLIDSEFFINLFQSPKFQKNILDNTIGTAIQNIASVKELKKIRILLPPLNEQRRIVEKIESEFAKIDEGLEHLQQAKEKIKQYRQSVLKSAFEGKLYKTSEWKEITLGEVVEPRRERITPTDKNGNMVYIGMDCIEPNSLYIHKQYKLKETKSVAFVFYKNDVLYGRMRSYLNKVWEATCNGTASAEFIVFPENDNIFSSYLKYLLHQQNFVKYATRNASGDRPRVKFESDLAGYKFRLPSIEEQKKIVEEIEKRFAVADEVEKVVEQNIEKAKQLKQSILKKAFEGRLVPQDPTDEPASILLEKIKQERSKKWE